MTETKYKLIDKNEFASILLFYERQMKFLPFSISNSISFDFSKQGYFQDENYSYFNTESLSGYMQLKSKFKKSPIHFKLGYRYTFEKYTFNSLETTLKQQQPYIDLNGSINKHLIWEVRNYYNLFQVNGSQRNILYVNPSLIFNDKKNNWSFGFYGTNILNLNTAKTIENFTEPGQTQKRITSILEGNILAILKYKF